MHSFDVSVGPGSVARVVELIDRLAEILVIGASRPIFEHDDRRNTIVKVEGESIRLRIVEELDRTKHEPTPEERLRLKEQHVYPRVPKWNYSPTGRLRLEISETLYGGKEVWSDRPDQVLEDLLPQIARAIRETAVRQRTRRTEIEEQARISAARERERWAEEERKRKRDERHRSLVAEAKRWQEAALLREYAGELQRTAATSSTTYDPAALGELIEELRDAADHLDPIPDHVGSLVGSTTASTEVENADDLDDGLRDLEVPAPGDGASEDKPN